ncbi:MAG: thiamine pyrophosphate-dependent enzyme [Opitutales bacterium]
MSETASDILVDVLRQWCVEIIFGLPGDGINGVIEALRKRQDEIRFVQVRHEESAAFMACAYAKYTGKLGVCLATSGPGGIHLLNGLYDAKLDHAPVLAITGHHFHDVIGTYMQQDVDLDKIFIDVSVYNQRIMGPAHVSNVTHQACREALAKRGVAHLNFPVDFQEHSLEVDSTSMRNSEIRPLQGFGRGKGAPLPAELQRAAQVLNEGRKIAILAGQGANHATDELLEVADLLGAPIIKALLGKACVPDDHELCMGGIGLLGTEPSEEAMQHCDTLFIVGSSFPYLEFLPAEGQAECVQVDTDQEKIGMRYPVDAGLLGDSKETLRELVPLLTRKKDRAFLEHRQKERKRWWELMEKRGTRQDKPMKPQVVAWELSKRLAEGAIVSSDSGSITTWWARQMVAKRGQMYSLSGTLASMANGLPYAIAAQLAYPDRQSVAFVGDGGFSMLMAEFVTAVRDGLPVKIVVINNRTLAQIKWEQMVFLGNPEYVVDLADIDYAKVAEACGGKGIRCDDPGEIGSAIDEMLAHPGPVVLDAVVDKQEPPMPAKIKYWQGKQMAASLMRGEKYRNRIVKTIAKDRVKEMI